MVALADCNRWNIRGQITFKQDHFKFFTFCALITCKVRRRTRGGMTEAEVRKMQEKAANQWMQEDRRGDRRGGAKEGRLA